MQDDLVSMPSWLVRGMADLFPHGDKEDSDQTLLKRLEEAKTKGRQLRVKLGIDPTGTDIHLGHAILFRKLRAFQNAGHKAILIIGDFTARIGDPTGKNKTRVQLSKEEVDSNSDSYLEQLGKGKDPDNSLLDFVTPGRLEVRRNSEWLSDLDLNSIINLLSTGTVGQMLAKEDFGNRYSSGSPISLHEFLYPLLQGYDSFAVNADLELGGTDQKFNIAMGRDIQRHFNQRPQFGLLMPILVGLDGSQKMSKSLGNIVGLSEDPLSMYSKLEKVPDELTRNYLTLLTDLDHQNIPLSPREIQKKMALSVTASIYGLESAKSAQKSAEKLVSGANQNNLLDIPEVSLLSIEFPVKAFYVLSAINLVSTSSEARRQIIGGAVRLDGVKITDPNLVFDSPSDLSGKVLQIGKKVFRRITN